MQNIYVITIIFLSNVVFSVHARPNAENSVYSELLELSTTKCPYLKTTKLLEPKPTFLDFCSSYTAIKSITSLNRRTAFDVPCLLYYNNFALLCETAAEYDLSKLVDDTTIDSAVKRYKLADVCADLRSVPLSSEFKNATEILKTFSKPNICERICTDLGDSTLTPICSFSAYSVNVTMKIHKDIELTKQKGKEVTEEKAPSNVAAEHIPQPPAPAKPKLVNQQSSVNVEHNDDPESPLHVQPQPTEVKSHIEEPGSRDSAPNLVVKDKVLESPAPDVPKPDDSILPVPKPEDTHESVVSSAQPAEPAVNIQQEEKPNLPASSSGSENPNVAVQSVQKAIPEVPPSDKSTASTANAVPNAVQEPKTAEDSGPQQPNEEQENDFNEEDNMNINVDDDDFPADNNNKTPEKQKNTKPLETDEDDMLPAYNNPNTDEEDSFFFIYFMMICAVFILGYIGYHNKQKVLALVIEGRRGRRGSRRGRPNSANYHKLDSNLEEAVTSACNKNTTNIIY